MATRLYFANNKGTPGITPAVDSGWENTSAGFGRYQAITSGTTDSSNDTPSAVGSGVANEDTVVFQLVYGPLAATTLTGTIKGQMAPREASGSTDARAQVIVRVIAPNGTTVRGTALAMDTAALSSEFNIDVSTRINRKFPRGGAQSLTSTAITAGDYIVIEAGFRNHGTNTSAVRMGSGADTSDYPEDETTSAGSGTTGRPWFEFSQTLSPLTTAVASSTTAVAISANNAKATVKPTGGNATIAISANDATVSFLAPPRTVLINSVDYTDKIRLDSFSFTECANNGEVGIGGIDIHDGASALDIPALKAVVYEEPQAGQSNKRTFTGFTHDRTTERGIQKVAGVREWGVELSDLNVLFDDFVLTAADSADRPAETDYARMVWLLTTGIGTTGLVGSGVVPNSNTVTMPAQDYRGRKARDPASDCLAASGKLCFIYDYGAGRKLYYDVATGTSLTSSAKISDVAADIDSSTVWVPYSPPQVKRSPDRIFSKVHLTWTGGVTTVSNATTASNYRTREAAVQDMSITDSAAATVLANSLLNAASTELLEVSGLSIAMPAANVNDIRQGQRVQIKLTRHGISSYTYYRVTRRTITPLGEQGKTDVMYLVTLQLASDVLPSANGGRGADDIPQNRSNSDDDGATVIIDRGGITVTDGAITVTNSGAIVIIDGSSNMFKIAATGTLSATAAAWVAGNITSGVDTVTLSGLGTLSEPPLHHSIVTPGIGSSNTRQLGTHLGSNAGPAYTSSTSGGSPTVRTIGMATHSYAYTYLNGSNQGVVALVVYNVLAAGDFSTYARYHILLEASI